MPLSGLVTRAALLAGVLLAGGSAFAADNIAEKAKLCATCHGEHGIPINKQTPVIWGQNEGYLYLQLRDYKSGARKNELMAPIAATLEKEDMLALAAHFTKLKWPNLQQPSAPPAVAKKAESGQRVDRLQGLPPRAFPGGRHHRASRRAMAGISASDHDGLPRRIARQQSGHVGFDGRHRAGRHRGVGSISRRTSDPRRSQGQVASA